MPSADRHGLADANAESEELRSEVDRLFGPIMHDAAGLLERAGSEEMLLFALGRLPETAADQRAYKIVLLLRSGLDLSDADRFVARMFRVTPVAARRMLVAAAARFPTDLDDVIRQAARRAVEQAEFDTERRLWYVPARPGPVREVVTEAVRGAGQDNPKTTHRAFVLALTTDALNAVRKECGLPPESEPG